MSDEQLVATLADDSRWWRSTAQRLLSERAGGSDRDATLARLAAMATEGPALGRLHALWTLDGLGALDEQPILAALESDSEGLRENAIRLAEPRLEKPAVRKAVLAHAEDPSVRVRFQVALSLGETAGDDRDRALASILERDSRFVWSRRAVLSAAGTSAESLLARVLAEPGRYEASLDLVRELADLVAAQGRETEAARRQLTAEANGSAMQIALLEGLGSGWARGGRGPRTSMEWALTLRPIAAGSSSRAALAAWRAAFAVPFRLGPTWTAGVAEARRRVADPGRAVEERVADAEILGLAEWDETGEALVSLLGAGTPGEIQGAALSALARFENVEVGESVVGRWRTILPAQRPRALRLLLGRPELHRSLLDAVAEGRIALGELNLDLEQRRALLREGTSDSMALAAGLIADEEYANRSEVVDEWLAKLPASGDAEAGRRTYGEVCAQCHRAAGEGSAVGPDFESLKHRSSEDLLSNILDPNMAINPAYAPVEVELVSGTVETGILARETQSALVLRRAFGEEEEIPRAQVRELRAARLSLMPEGLEAERSPQELRDLIAFIQSL